MAIVTVVSAKHSPGATTLAMAVASAADPFTLPLVLEADPAGGDLAARVGVLFEPGMASVVEAARTDQYVGLVEEHCRLLPSGIGVIVGSIHPRQVATYLGDAAAVLVDPLRRRGGLTVVDGGRWGAPSTAAWARLSDALVLTLRPTIESAEHASVRLRELRRTCPLVRPVVIGNGPLAPDDVADIIEHPVWNVPHDPTTARHVCEGIVDLDDLRTTPLWKAAEAILTELLATIDVTTSERRRRTA